MAGCQNEDFLRQVRESRAAYRYDYDFRGWTEQFSASTLSLLFPHFGASPKSETVDEEIVHVGNILCEALTALGEHTSDPCEVQRAFCASLPEVYRLLNIDAQAFYESDPAAESVDEIIFAYPGFYAVALHRIAHILYTQSVPFLPRLIAESAHSRTGIDIHPGATIGESFFLDHGTGIVIGETAVVKDRVRIYQGVTLGAHYVHKRLSGVKRHPTIEDDVVIYAHATILGGSTVVGARSVIGANSWVTQSIAADSIVSHKSTVRKAEESDYEVIDFSI
jgi:serine O-acetyltransferase